MTRSIAGELLWPINYPSTDLIKVIFKVQNHYCKCLKSIREAEQHYLEHYVFKFHHKVSQFYLMLLRHWTSAIHIYLCPSSLSSGGYSAYVIPCAADDHNISCVRSSLPAQINRWDFFAVWSCWYFPDCPSVKSFQKGISNWPKAASI